MVPTIRVDDDVYGALQKRAEPFVDTPNTVIQSTSSAPDQRDHVSTFRAAP